MRWQRRWVLGALLGSMVLASACGNRLSHQQVLAENGIGASRTQAQSASSDASGGVAGSPTAAALGIAGASGGASGGSSGGTSGRAGGPGAAAGQAPGQAGGVATGAKSTVVIAMVGWLSGIGGYNSGPIRDGLAAWSKAVNAKGGVNGHPVQLLIADDGGDESKSLSIVRDMVENKHAIALVGYSGGSAVAVSNYAKTKNVPMIGGLVIEQLWTQNPMTFPNVASTDGHEWGIAKLAVQAGVKKVATVYCTEVAACQQSNDVFVQQAKAVGLQVVYQGKISFTQPDYTADCLQMQSAGAEGVVPITENNSSIRLAQSCGRQGFKPRWLLSVGNDAMAQVPEFDGAIATLVGFPWFVQSGSPALDEYAQALKRYAPDRAASGVDWQVSGWTAGKLFELAAQHLSDHPSSQETLDGLWQMRGETLGGLVPPRTFNRGQPTSETYCDYEAVIQGGKWVAPNGLQPVCR